jgi:hypothetical protein
MTYPPSDLKISCGKQLSVWLYCVNAISLDELEHRFARHPEWKAA